MYYINHAHHITFFLVILLSVNIHTIIIIITIKWLRRKYSVLKDSISKIDNKPNRICIV